MRFARTIVTLAIGLLAGMLISAHLATSAKGIVKPCTAPGIHKPVHRAKATATPTLKPLPVKPLNTALPSATGTPSFTPSPTPTPIPSATPLPSATPQPTPVPPGTILNLSGGDLTDRKFDSQEFKVQGPFTVSYTAAPAPGLDQYSYGSFSATLQNHDFGFDEIASAALSGSDAATTGSTTESHFDCSGGCYFTIESKGIAWTLTVAH